MNITKGLPFLLRVIDIYIRQICRGCLFQKQKLYYNY